MDKSKNMKVVVDFSNYPELFAFIEKMATENIRPIGFEIINIIHDIKYNRYAWME